MNLYIQGILFNSFCYSSIGSRSFCIQVDSHTSWFAYIEVVSPTWPWSIRIHRSRFSYIEKKKKRSHKHSNRIAIGQRNKLNLNLAICACSYYVSRVIFVWHSERVDSAETKFKYSSCTMSRRILLCCLYALAVWYCKHWARLQNTRPTKYLT